ncbi:MAG: hypothetical protein H0W49_03945 [Nitrospirales bacterium]|nr:hypothetical protein [Nitrospirales bacterium]
MAVIMRTKHIDGFLRLMEKIPDSTKHPFGQIGSVHIPGRVRYRIALNGARRRSVLVTIS